MQAFIVADIGGTRARFGLAEAHNGTVTISKRATYRCAELGGIDAALSLYRTRIGQPLPKQACIAVAGPVQGDAVQLTNLDWDFTIAELRRRWGFERLEVVNDFFAVACAPPQLKRADLYPIKTGRSLPGEPRAMIGAGTGMGVAATVPVNGSYLPFASEGGHATLGVATDEEREVMRIVRRWAGHVSVETLLSGPGLSLLHQACARMRGRTETELGPEDITALALNDSDESCVYTVNSYCALLGGFAGDIALYFRANGGVLLVGKLLRSIAPLLKRSEFEARFAAKGAMHDFVADIPVHLVTVEEPGLIGAAAWFAAQQDPDFDQQSASQDQTVAHDGR